jgi:hypothetical protein
MVITDKDLFGWSPENAANRAIQSFFGLCLLLLASDNNGEFINDLTKNTLSSLEKVSSSSIEENIQIFLNTRNMFYMMLDKIPFPLLNATHERIWQLFLERFDLRTCQLRINLIDMHDCINIFVLAKSLDCEERYFYQLPLSSEIVVTSAKGGIHVEVYIPPRLLILDMIIMLLHAKEEHQKLELAARNQNGQLIIELKRDGLLDTYSRQVLIIATTVCDNILTEYGLLVEEIQKSTSENDINELIKLHKLGVTQRLKRIPTAWNRVLGKNISIDSNVINDMTILVQIRNRLVHPDGRVNCWHAFQLSPLTSDGWQFSERINPYLTCSAYGAPNSSIGYEFALARFCVDTSLQTVNIFHNLLFENRIPWLEFSLNPNGELDLEKIIQTELSFFTN